MYCGAPFAPETVKAAIGTNSTVMELRNKLLDAKDAAKERKIVLQDERMKSRDARLQAIYSDKKDKHLEDNKLFRLKKNF